MRIFKYLLSSQPYLISGGVKNVAEVLFVATQSPAKTITCDPPQILVILSLLSYVPSSTLLSPCFCDASAVTAAAQLRSFGK